MSTASQIERAHAATGVVINPGGAAAGGADDRATRLAAAEAVAAVAVEMARQAAAAAGALRLKMEGEPEPAGGSRSLVGCHRQSLSPERRRGRRSCSPVLQTVYRDSGAGMQGPMLTKSNYHKWSLLMKVKM
jgi:hypothetical protein